MTKVMRVTRTVLVAEGDLIDEQAAWDEYFFSDDTPFLVALPTDVDAAYALQAQEYLEWAEEEEVEPPAEPVLIPSHYILPKSCMWITRDQKAPPPTMAELVQDCFKPGG